MLKKLLLMLLVVVIVVFSLTGCKYIFGPADPKPELPKSGRLVVDYYSDGAYADGRYVCIVASWTGYTGKEMTKVGERHWQYIKQDLSVNSQFYEERSHPHYAQICHAGYVVEKEIFFNGAVPKNIYRAGSNGRFWYFWFDGSSVIQ